MYSAELRGLPPAGEIGRVENSTIYTLAGAKIDVCLNGGLVKRKKKTK